MAITAASLLGGKAKAAYVPNTVAQSTSAQGDTGKKDRGGLIGGVGYLGEKAAAGLVQSLEGIVDFGVGGIADLLGADAFAERQFKNDWFGDWYDTAGDWYNPSRGWKVAGDIAGGIGTSLPALAVSGIGIGIAAATGGAGTPLAIGLIAGSTAATAGLSAAGTATKEAYRKSGNLGLKEYGYGALVGVTEGAIEGVSNAIGVGTGAVVKGIAGGVGKGVAKGAAKGAGKAAFKSTIKSATASLGKHAILKTGVKAFAGEAFEEGVAELLSPIYARMTYDPEASLASPQEIAYASFVGGMSGLVMGGATGTVNMARHNVSGNQIYAKGQAQSVVDGAKALLADAEKSGSMDTDAVKALKSVYDRFTASAGGTSAASLTGNQRRLLGAMNEASAAVVMNEAVISSAINIVQNAEQITKSLEAYNYTDENGNKVTFTAEQLREGILGKDGKIKRDAIATALKNNTALRTLAAADAAGRLMMDTTTFADAMMQGTRVDEHSLNAFIENASEKKKAEVGKLLGVSDWNAVDAEEINARIGIYMMNGGAQVFEDRSLAVNAFEQHRGDKTRAIPSSFKATKDGVYRYSSNGDNIAVSKHGDTYAIYDYDEKVVTRDLSRAELNRILAKHAREAQKPTESAANPETVSEEGQTQEQPSTEASVNDTEAKENTAPEKSVVARAREIAETKVKGYDKLPERNKSMVRKVIRQGIVKGIPEELLIDFANVSANAKVDVVFDKDPLLQGRTEDGREVYANGAYDPHSDKIYINPDVQTSDDILIHELDHAIRKTVKGGKVTTAIYAKALKAAGVDTYEKIADRYLGKAKNMTLEERVNKGEIKSLSEKLDVVEDEVEAFYAQTVLGSRGIIKHLVSETPSLKQRILDFFKGAKADYRDVPNLDRQAAKYYRQYKKWFDEYAGNRRYKTMGDAVSKANAGDLRYSFAGVTAKNAEKLKLSTAEQLLSNGVDSETVRQETGWFKGYDGKWRFEIDDSAVEVAFNGKFSRDPDIRRYAELVEKAYFLDTATKAEREDLIALDKKIGGKSVAPNKLGDLMKHPALFSAYPQLQDIEVYFHDGKEENASYHPGFKEISIAKSLKRNPKKFKQMLLHEVQHAVQDLEGFSAGSNPDMFNNTAERSAFEQYRETAGEIEARDVSNRIDLSNAQRKNTRPDIDRKDVVLVDDRTVSYFAKNEKGEESASIKYQIRGHLDEINAMEPVADITYNVVSKEKAKNDALNLYKTKGMKIDRPSFGEILLGEAEINQSTNYLNTPAEFAAWMAIPAVLKRGRLVSGHENHKGEGFPTYTIAAPVIINGKRGIIGAVVKRTGKYRYKMHRILMPDGSAFIYQDMKKNAEPTGSDILLGEKGPDISSASTIIIPETEGKINPSDENSSKKSSEPAKDSLGNTMKTANPDMRFSLPESDTEYLSAVERGDMDTAQRMVDEAAKSAMPQSKITMPDGSLRKVYHGTNTGDFTVFNPDYIGMSSGDGGFFGRGFYFAYSEGEAKYYGAERIISAYLNLTNPFDFQRELQTFKGKRAESGRAPDAVAFLNFAEKFPDIAAKTFVDVYDGEAGRQISLVDFAKSYRDVIENKKFEYQPVENEYGEKETLVLADKTEHTYEDNGVTRRYVDYGFQKRFWGEANELDVAYEYLSTVVYDYIDMYSRTRLILESNDEFTAKLREMGYDGAIQSQYGDEAVAFFPEQIKSADPVTYDDSGNVIPLYKRFDPTNKDIRFSLPADESAVELESVTAPSIPNIAGENLTVGQMRKRIANASHYKMYSKKNALIVVKQFDGADLLSQKTQDELATVLWKRLNEAKNRTEMKTYAHDVAEYILSRVMSEAKVEKTGEAMDTARARLSALSTYIGKVTFTESEIEEIRHVRDKKGLRQILGRWGYKSSRGDAKVPLDVFVTDIVGENADLAYLKELHPVDAFLELDSIYEDAKNTVNDKWESVYYDVNDEGLAQIVQDMENDILLAFEYLGEETEYKRRITSIVDRYKRRSDYWKAEHDKVNKVSRWHNIVADQAQKLKDIATHRFANATQIENDTLDQSIGDLAKVIRRGNISVTKVREVCEKLLMLYNSKPFRENVLEYFDENNVGYFNGLIETYLEVLSGSESIKPDGYEYTNSNGKSLSATELRMLSSVLSYFQNLYENYGKVWRRGQLVEALPLAQEFIGIAKSNSALPMGKIKSALARMTKSAPVQTFADPASVIRRIDLYQHGFYTEMFEQLREAAYNAEIAQMRVMKEYDEFLRENKGYMKKASRETVEFRGEKISKIKLISLYCTSKRKQAQAGLAINGYQYTGLNGDVIRVDGALDANAAYTEEEIGAEISNLQRELEKHLTEADKKYIALLENIYNNEARQLKVNRDLERNGFTNVEEGYYYPIRRANTATSVDKEMQGEIDRVSNASFNKDVVKGAKQEVLIESADNLIRRHVYAVCQYAYLSPVIDSYNHIYNLDTAGNRNRPVSVRTETRNVWSEGDAYMRKMFSDIQGITENGAGSKILSYIRGSYAISALAANPKVWLTQLSSFAAASSLLDADLIFKGAFASRQNLKDIFTYCPVAELRAYENTAAMAQAVVDNKGKARGAGSRALGATQKFGQFLMTPIGLVDKNVIKRLFGACQLQVQRNSGGEIKVGTERNKIEAGKLLTRVIFETQQNTLSTEKSAAMRSGNEIYKTLTMFSADAMKVVGRVFDSFGELFVLKERIKQATDPKTKSELQARLKVVKRSARKATVAIVATSVYMTALSLAFRRLYNKDEEETVPALVAETFGNMLGGLPVIRDVYSLILDGYDIDHYAYSAVNDMVKGVLSLGKAATAFISGDGSRQDLARSGKNVIFSVSQLTGIPTRNFYNVTYGLTKRFSPSTAYKIDSIFCEKNYANDLTKALEDGDTDMANMIYSILYNERVGVDISDESLSELHGLAARGYKVLPRKVASEITLDGVEYALSGEEQAAIQSEYARRLSSLDALVASSRFQAMTYEEKEYAAQYLFDICYKSAEASVLGIDRGNAAILANVISADKLTVLATKANAIKAEGDERRKKTVAMIKAMDATQAEKLIMICLRGYSVKDGDIPGVTAESAKQIMLKYILSASVTKAQKEKLAKMCGFTVKDGKILLKSK